MVMYQYLNLKYFQRVSYPALMMMMMIMMMMMMMMMMMN